jgi:hypothetical protein
MPAKKRSTARPSTPVEATPVSDWKKKNTSNFDKPVELPSGKFMKIRRVGFRAFIKAGLIPNSLMATVQSSIDRGVAPELNLGSILQDDKQIDAMMDMVDGVLCFVAVEPEVHPLPKNEKDRDEELLYVDEVDDEDKMFIFGLCTGDTDDVQQFRSEQTKRMASVHAG